MQMVVAITTEKQEEAGKHSPHSPVPFEIKMEGHMKAAKGLGITPTDFSSSYKHAHEDMP